MFESKTAWPIGQESFGFIPYIDCSNLIVASLIIGITLLLIFYFRKMKKP